MGPSVNLNPPAIVSNLVSRLMRFQKLGSCASKANVRRATCAVPETQSTKNVRTETVIRNLRLIELASSAKYPTLFKSRKILEICVLLLDGDHGNLNARMVYQSRCLNRGTGGLRIRHDFLVHFVHVPELLNICQIDGHGD